ncbi:MAG: chemotaxis-specific protein-glutamate methyltransferase CheB [Betaproteobacteria bacterium]|nr:chemotaxis-specific protein-glutamate methyltransferase CheB [Betaproteobacteria bacterium]
MIKILITEDSEVVATLLKAIFESEPDMRVVGWARNGREAVTLAHDLKPDVVTMDIRMPVMDGFDATRMLMSTAPLPIVVVSSSVDDEELRITFRAIDEGALAVIEKPRGILHPDFDKVRVELVETVRAMSEVKVVRRRRPRPNADIFKTIVARRTGAIAVVGIACSTGGPQALAALLGGLPVGFPLPVLVVQHISAGFVGGLVNWLRGQTLLDVALARDLQALQAGTVYLAPDGYHLEVTRAAGQLAIHLSDAPPTAGFRPSGNVLFHSLAKVCPNAAVGGILTGMGNDGADGLAALRKAGGRTFVQDEESAVVYGMPGAALALNAVDSVVPLPRIPAHLIDLARS